MYFSRMSLRRCIHVFVLIFMVSLSYEQFDQQSETKLLRGSIFHKHHLFSTVSASDSSNEGIEQKEK